ncbi:MAG: formate/nitrite transporter family protein [Thermoanaerobacteraceae bacterium]
MYKDSINQISETALKKVSFAKSNLLGYIISSMLAGIFVGIGIILTFSIAAPFSKENLPVIKSLMGASFGVALTIVIFAGSELFTGNNLVMTIGYLNKKSSIYDLLKIWTLSYIGNLLGSIFLAYLFVNTGLVISPLSDFILKISSSKMSAPFIYLFVRGILCNMLVCLAVWMTSRTKDDTAKIMLIWWALFAFVGSGFEHSVANMTLLSTALMIPHDPNLISLSGFINNLVPVTLGNIVGGAIIVGVSYYIISLKEK